jgi:hypothetical protein
MIIDTALQDSIQIRKDLVNFTRDLSDHSYLFGIGQTRKDTNNFMGFE